MNSKGKKLLKEAGAAYVNAGVLKVAVDTGMAASAFTPLSRVVANNLVDISISTRVKRGAYKGRSRTLGAAQSGYTLDSVGPTFSFTINSDIEHLRFLEHNKDRAFGSPFKSREAAKKAFIEYMQLYYKQVYPNKSDNVLKYYRKAV